MEDVTALVHPDLVGTSLQSERSSTVDALTEPEVPALLAAGVAPLGVLGREHAMP